MNCRFSIFVTKGSEFFPLEFHISFSPQFHKIQSNSEAQHFSSNTNHWWDVNSNAFPTNVVSIRSKRFREIDSPLNRKRKKFNVQTTPTYSFPDESESESESESEPELTFFSDVKIEPLFNFPRELPEKTMTLRQSPFIYSETTKNSPLVKEDSPPTSSSNSTYQLEPLPAHLRLLPPAHP